MNVRNGIIIGLAALLALAVATGFAFAAGPGPAQEPTDSPFFDASLQQAVDELDGRAGTAGVQYPATIAPTQHYTTDPNLWKECEFGFTRDLAHWPSCHYTSDPEKWTYCKAEYPTKDYTWDATLWKECGTEITQDANAAWCNPHWTLDPKMGPQCNLAYTTDPAKWPWCNPRFTWDPASWPNQCSSQPPYYTYDDRWPECTQAELTTDVARWAACHYTSDPLRFGECGEAYPTQDYTSNSESWPECPAEGYTTDVKRWPWCDPKYTTEPRLPDCTAGTYTQSEAWPWCTDSLYTSQPVQWPQCHYTSDPERWSTCKEKYPTKDYTWDANIWSECDVLTKDAAVWPWCETKEYTQDAGLWPWCNQAWTSDAQLWPACDPGYTYDPEKYAECDKGLYTQNPETWPECSYQTADASVWPECHYTSDPKTWPYCVEIPPYPTKDYTTDPRLWPECSQPAGYTTDAEKWPACHYTSDPTSWPECEKPELGDLGDAPDRTNHAGANMTAYPRGGPPGILARYPSIFDAATGLPQGPKHWQPHAVGWLGPEVTLEDDADLLPDEDGVSNLDPPSDTPDRDKADDGVQFPVAAPHCEPAVMTYTLTITPGGPGTRLYVNVWFDWNRDGDWADIAQCPGDNPTPAPEWAVQNQLLPALPAGVHTFVTPAYLPWNPAGGKIPDIWMRISVAELPAAPVPGAAVVDGRGPPNGYQYGETEDYYFKPACPPPDADFKWDPPNLCTKDTVQFWDTSTNSPTSWSWDFGDGSPTSSVQNPSHAYSSAGTYSVSLKVTNGCGSDKVTKRLVVKDCPAQKDYDIYLKDNTADDGSVPSPMPTWGSPDIWVRTAGDCGNTTPQNPIAGAVNTICIRVRNRLATTVDDITVNIYYTAAAIATYWPGSWSYVNSVHVGSLAGGADTVAAALWNTPYTTGHFCLLARADAPKDPINSGPDTVAPVHLINNNNNIAGKNQTIVDFPEVAECPFASTQVYTSTVLFDAVNTWATNKSVDIVLDSDDFPLADGQLILEPGSLWGRWTSLTHFDQSGHTLLPTGFPATLGAIYLDPHETARLTMTIVAEIDERFTVGVEERIDGTAVGGIDYIRELPDCLYLPLILRDYLP